LPYFTFSFGVTLGLPKEDFDHLVIVDSHLKRKFSNDKESILDVRLFLKSGIVINVEAQARITRGLWKRIAFAGAKLLSEQLKRGEDYYSLKRAASIIICDGIRDVSRKNLTKGGGRKTRQKPLCLSLEAPLGINSAYKDSVCSLLFNDPEILRELHPGRRLTAPGFANHHQYPGGCLFMERVNDLSFAIADVLAVVFEHQLPRRRIRGLRPDGQFLTPRHGRPVFL
jgi:hypothetical protein